MIHTLLAQDLPQMDGPVSFRSRPFIYSLLKKFSMIHPVYPLSQLRIYINTGRAYGGISPKARDNTIDQS